MHDIEYANEEEDASYDFQSQKSEEEDQSQRETEKKSKESVIHHFYTFSMNIRSKK